MSRKTVYKWLGRHDEEGLAGLHDVSRRPHHSPNQLTAEVEAAIVAARHRWRWGPGKLRVKLCQQDSQTVWPAVSTIAAVLKAKGLVVVVATGHVFPFNALRILLRTRRTRCGTPISKAGFVAGTARV